jgi:hypothetical protein
MSSIQLFRTRLIRTCVLLTLPRRLSRFALLEPAAALFRTLPRRLSRSALLDPAAPTAGRDSAGRDSAGRDSAGRGCACAFLGLLLATGVAADDRRSDKELEYDGTRPLISARTLERQNPLSELDYVLRSTVANEVRNQPKAIVLYVHGRGDEPRDSLFEGTEKDGRTMQKIEDFGVAALAFNWDGRGKRCDLPRGRAGFAGQDFAKLVDAIKAHKRMQPDFWAGRPITLLVEGLGAEVVKAAVEKTSFGGVFNRAIFTAADVSYEDHADWMDAGRVASITLNISNPRDSVLAKSRKCASKELGSEAPLMLGQIDPNQQGEGVSIQYLVRDEDAKKDHRYFTAGTAYPNANMCLILRALYRGQPIPADTTESLGSNLRQIPRRKEKDHECFRNILKDKQ